MEIKRKFEILVATKRQFVVRQSPLVKPKTCEDCGGLMLITEQAASLLSIKQRRIFQIVETGTTHFMENETGVLMICLQSLDRFLKSEM